MGDLSFAESLGILEGSDYSPWVKVIFQGIKTGTRLRSIKMMSKFTNYLMEEWVFKSEAVRAKQFEHWNYSKERVNRRLARNPDRPDLWTKILEKGAPNDKEGLSLGEHHSLASVFMIAGTETTATALSGTTYQLLTNPDKLNYCRLSLLPVRFAECVVGLRREIDVTPTQAMNTCIDGSDRAIVPLISKP